MCKGVLGQPCLMQRLFVSVRVRYYLHLGEWVGGSVWKLLDLQQPSLSLFDQHSDGVVWQAEPGRFCAANNVFVSKVSARGSGCSPAAPSARTHRCQNPLQPHLKRQGTWKWGGGLATFHSISTISTPFFRTLNHFYTASLAFWSMGFSNDS